MSARDVIARATCGDRDVEGWIPCTECEENAERVMAAVRAMSIEDLADLTEGQIETRCYVDRGFTAQVATPPRPVSLAEARRLLGASA